MSKDLFKEAIADAKAVKETAIENAKAALEEAFTPHIKSMFAAKLEQLDEVEDKMEEAEDKMDEMKDEKELEKENLDEMDLEEILKELESLGEMSDDEMKEESLEEAEDKDADKMEEGKDEKEEKEDMKEMYYEDSEEEFNIEDMSEDDLKAFIEDVISDMMASGEIEGGEDEEGEEDMDMDMDMDMETKEAPIDELDVNELLAEIEALEEAKKKKEKKEEEKDEEKEKLKKDLKEALDTLEVLKEELNEINLLNAKLLYTNKIFKAKNLTESEKVKVLTTFDKASTVKEAKLVYETLLEGLTAKTKSPIKESLGSASKTIVTASPKQPIIETNEVFARMQKLAGIK